MRIYITEGIYIEPFYRIVYFSGPRLVAILNRYFFAKSDASDGAQRGAGMIDYSADFRIGYPILSKK
jgi:hypothetical protein